jgi:phosphatidylglycerol---prolipoprotein diacylglyceryl transferase
VLPHFELHLFGLDLHLHTYTTMMALYAIFAIIAFSLSFRRERKVLNAFALSLTVAVAAFFGARLFHLLVEKPVSEFTFDQMLIFDGMTFYGSLIAGVLFTAVLTPILFRKSEFSKVSDIAAIITAAGYGFLRIGCFANGCCWGRLTAVPWAVRYTESETMPAIGLPVHPVQLCDRCGSSLSLPLKTDENRVPRAFDAHLLDLLFNWPHGH